MRKSVKQVVNQAASEMRSPSRFPSLVDGLETHFRQIDDETLRDLGLSPGRPNQDWEGLAETMAEEGNLFLVFDGSGSEVPFVVGDESQQLRACFVITDPVPFERPLTTDNEFVAAREGFNGWSVREYRSSVLDTIFALGEEPESGGEDTSAEEED